MKQNMDRGLKMKILRPCYENSQKRHFKQEDISLFCVRKYSREIVFIRYMTPDERQDCYYLLFGWKMKHFIILPLGLRTGKIIPCEGRGGGGSKDVNFLVVKDRQWTLFRSVSVYLLVSHENSAALPLISCLSFCFNSKRIGCNLRQNKRERERERGKLWLKRYFSANSRLKQETPSKFWGFNIKTFIASCQRMWSLLLLPTISWIIVCLSLSIYLYSLYHSPLFFSK